jgi:4-diphosphocytidyl-2-C-methyl-D-erythritol kinase
MWTDLGNGQELAPAKINLTLHVTGRRPDGYHMLDSYVVFPRIGDVLSYEPSSRLGLTLGGPFGIDLGVDENNLVLRAAEFLGVQEAALHLDKRLPIASGIGGGSSDAAATLRLLARVLDRPLPPTGETVALGADVPVCLLPMAQRMRGIGEDVSPLPDCPQVWLVLVNPGVPVSTPEIFRRLEQVHNAPCAPWPSMSTAGDLVAFLKSQRNDMQSAAEALCPPISDVLSALEHSGAALARMSGSGATCFGLFETENAALGAADQLRAERPMWWVTAGPIR